MKVTLLELTCLCMVLSVIAAPIPSEENHNKKTETQEDTDLLTAETVWPIWGPGFGYPGQFGGYYPQSWFPPPGFLGPPISGGYGIIPPGGTFGSIGFAPGGFGPDGPPPFGQQPFGQQYQ